MKVFKYILTSLFLLYSVMGVAQTTQEITQGTEVNYHISTISGSSYIYIWSIDNEKDVVVISPDTIFNKLWDKSYAINSNHSLQVVGQSIEGCNSAPRKMTVFIKSDTGAFSNNAKWKPIGTDVCPYPQLDLQVSLTKTPTTNWYISYELNGTTYYARGGVSGNNILSFSISGTVPELSTNGAKSILLRGIFIGNSQIIYSDKDAPQLNFNISRPQISNIKF